MWNSLRHYVSPQSFYFIYVNQAIHEGKQRETGRLMFTFFFFIIFFVEQILTLKSFYIDLNKSLKKCIQKFKSLSMHNN